MKIGIKDAELAWLAGLVDGDGSICISKSKNNKGHVQLTVTNSHKDTIDRLREMVGTGHVRLKRRSPGLIINRRPCYLWMVNTNKACSILSFLLPYLFTKKEQAILAIAYQRTSGEEERGAIQSRISNLNHGGL